MQGLPKSARPKEKESSASSSFLPATYERIGLGPRILISSLQNWRYFLNLVGAYLIIVVFQAEGATKEVVFFGTGYLLAGGIESISLADLVSEIHRLESRGLNLPKRVSIAKEFLSDAGKLIGIASAVEGVLLKYYTSIPQTDQSVATIIGAVLIATTSTAIALIFWQRILSEAEANRSPSRTARFFTLIVLPISAFGLYQLAVITGVTLMLFTIAAFLPLVVLSLAIGHYLDLGTKLMDASDVRKRRDSLEAKRSEILKRLEWIMKPTPKSADDENQKRLKQNQSELSEIDREIVRCDKAIRLYSVYISKIIKSLSLYATRREGRENFSDLPLKSVTGSKTMSDLARSLGRPPSHCPRSYLKTLRLGLIRRFVIPQNMSLILNAHSDSPVGFDNPRALRVATYLDRVTYDDYAPQALELAIYEYEKSEVVWAATQTIPRISMVEFLDFILSYRLILQKQVRLLLQRVSLFDEVSRIDPSSQYSDLRKVPGFGRPGLLRASKREGRNLHLVRKAVHELDPRLLEQGFGEKWNAMVAS